MIQDQPISHRASRQIRCWTRWAMHEFETVAERRLNRRVRMWGVTTHNLQVVPCRSQGCPNPNSLSDRPAHK